MLHDQHCHTSYSLDSKASIEKYFQIAQEMKCQYFITTEHIEFDSVYTKTNWTVDYQSLLKDLNTLSSIYQGVIPLLGVELGYRKDHLKEMSKLIDSQSFDLVNLSIHDNGKYDYYMQEGFIQLGINNMLDIYFNNILEALDNFDNFDVLSHFDYGYKSAYLVNNKIDINDYKAYIIAIFKKIIEMNKTLELNIKVQETINDDKTLKTWLMWYYNLGGRDLTISSDAHLESAYKDYYQSINHYHQIIKDIGFTKLCYFVKRQKLFYNL